MSKFVGVGLSRRAERYGGALFAVIAVLLATSAFTLANRQEPPAHRRLLPRPPVSALASRDDATPPQPGDQLVAAPLSVTIPAIGVAARIVDLGLDSRGALAPPTDVNTVGWYAGGPAPGAVGPAVLAAHVDSRRGRAVFWALRDLLPGDLVSVTGTDGRVQRFAVTAVHQYAKDGFPTNEVYGVQAAPVLRLITCGGVFDKATGHYRDNIVVYAQLADG